MSNSKVVTMIASTRSPIATRKAIVASSIQGTGAQKWLSTRLTGCIRSSATALKPNCA